MRALFYVVFIQGVIQSCLCVVAVLPVALLHGTKYSFVLTGGITSESLEGRITMSRGMIVIVTVFSIPCALVILTTVLALYIDAAGLFLDAEEEQVRSLAGKMSLAYVYESFGSWCRVHASPVK